MPRTKKLTQSTSPVSVPVVEPIVTEKWSKKVSQRMSFPDAMAEAFKGNRITKEEWNSQNNFAMLRNGTLQIYTAGKEGLKWYNWIISDGDMAGLDWFVVE